MNIESFRQHCLSFPAATENVQWGNDLVFKVAGKMFAVACLDRAAPNRASFKCSPEEFAELCEREGIIPAPYMARAQWVALEGFDVLADVEIRRLLRQSYDLVVAKLPKKTREGLNRQRGPARRRPPRHAAARAGT